MAVNTRINPSSKTNNDTGFGVNADSYGGRFINKDGTFNLVKEGLPYWQRFSVFHAMINMPRWKFISVIILFFISINLVYTLIYIVLGIDGLQGYYSTDTWSRIKEIFFFSTETFTTVGYGRVNPVSDSTNLVAAFEAMSGFISFAIATGLFYGRFSKPKAFLKFTDFALIAPFHDKEALMFRFVSYKDNHTLTNAEVKVSLSLLVSDNGNTVYKFYDLPLERNHVDLLPMNFTVVHPIDENSPLLNLSYEDMKAADFEVYVLIRAFDETYSTTVLQRTSYTYNEITFNAKFVPMYRESEDGKTTIIELHKLNEYKKLR